MINDSRDHIADINRNHNKDNFTFGKVNSLDYGIYLTGIQVGGTPERDVSFVQVAGRNGDLAIDNKRWNNIDVTYHCAIISNFADLFDQFRNAILSQRGYQRLIDTIYPDVFRLGIIQQSMNPKTMRLNRTGTFDVTFHCKPQRFFCSHESAVSLTEVDLNDRGVAVFNNGSKQPSRPIITVHGTAGGTLTVGTVMVEILTLSDQITIDCDLMTVYRQVGDAAPENKNADIYAPEFPELTVGVNEISWTGGITRVDITPRGWML